MIYLRATAICPASCGEIVQGMIGDRNFLITCPVAIYTEVSVELAVNMTADINNDKSPNHKALSAVKRTLSFFRMEHLRTSVTVKSEIPRGIGLASSTADITAACLATAQALGKEISNDTIADIALSIEPSDGIMYPGTMLFDHIEGRLRKSLGPIPELDVYIIDTGQRIDTEEFNNVVDLKEKNKQKEPQVKQALKLALRALRRADVKSLGKAMKISAIAHQSILFKPHLYDVIDVSDRYRAVGVNVAHSGSAIGIFFNKGQNPPEAFWDELSRIMQSHNVSYRIIKTRTDNKGPRICIENKE